MPRYQNVGYAAGDITILFGRNTDETSGDRRTAAGVQQSVGLGHVPDATLAVAGHVAGLLVLGERVEGLALIGPHL